MPEPKSLADLVSSKEYILEFWRTLALGLLRRSEAQEPGFAEAAKSLLLELSSLADTIEEAATLGNAWMKLVKDPYARDLKTLEAELSTLRVDRRKLRTDPWPIPRDELAPKYSWLFFYIRTLKRISRQEGLDAAIDLVYRSFQDSSVTRKDYLTFVGKNPVRFWWAALLFGFLRYEMPEIPDAATLDAMGHSCLAEPPGAAALSVLALCCQVTDPKTGRIRSLSAEKIKQYVSASRPRGRKAQEAYGFETWPEAQQSFWSKITGKDSPWEKLPHSSELK